MILLGWDPLTLAADDDGDVVIVAPTPLVPIDLRIHGVEDRCVVHDDCRQHRELGRGCLAATLAARGLAMPPPVILESIRLGYIEMLGVWSRAPPMRWPGLSAGQEVRLRFWNPATFPQIVSGGFFCEQLHESYGVV